MIIIKEREKKWKDRYQRYNMTNFSKAEKLTNGCEIIIKQIIE